MSYDEEGAFGAQTTFCGSRWVYFGRSWVLAQLLVTCTEHPIMMDPEQFQSESLDQVKISFIAYNPLAHPPCL